MTNLSLRVLREKEQSMSIRANALAERLESGVRELARFAATVTDAEWSMPVSATDRRKIGVIVDHVANVFPIEIQLAQQIAAGTPIEGVTWADVAKINAEHATTVGTPTKEQALERLRVNSENAAEAIRALSDGELDRAVTNSMYGDAILTCQFMLEDHAVRHAYHHLAKIRKALKR